MGKLGKFLAAALILLLIFAGWLIVTPKPAGIPILEYHKIDAVDDAEGKEYNVPPAEFEKQLAYLQAEGYTTITLLDYMKARKGKLELPAKPIVLTFDDGYEDNYTNAYPILKKYGFKGTIFVISSFLGKNKNYITWDQAREMDADGINIESHTVDHKSMTDLTDDELREELVASKKKIEEELGHPIGYMAYPTGTYNLHIAQLVKEAGYKAAFTIKYGNVDKASNIYALERVPIFHTENTNRDFLERIRYTPIFERLGWIKS